MIIEFTTLQDSRTAKQITRARKFTYQLSKRDKALLQNHAAEIAVLCPEAQLIGFHKRRIVTVWLAPGNKGTLELRGEVNHLALEAERLKAA